MNPRREMHEPQGVQGSKDRPYGKLSSSLWADPKWPNGHPLVLRSRNLKSLKMLFYSMLEELFVWNNSKRTLYREHVGRYTEGL